jgi:hypothetical protein
MGLVMIATESFDAEIDGRHERIHEGRDRIDSDHEIVRRYPGKFEAESVVLDRVRALAKDPRNVEAGVDLRAPRTRRTEADPGQFGEPRSLV